MNYLPRLTSLAAVFALGLPGAVPRVQAAEHAAAADLWDTPNLAAWCIVPYDARQRGPAERAAMLASLGIKYLAYDWRPVHQPTFDEEVVAMKRQGITISAWWFPATLNEPAQAILAVIERHGIRPELWLAGSGGAPVANATEQRARVEQEAARVRPIAEAAARLGCKVGLYNHGGWFGEPDNQLAILERLASEGVKNVGLVYNFHHGHDHLESFAYFWPRIQPHVLAVNLNGMRAGADKAGAKILYVGEGDRELELMRIIHRSGWRGRVGILNHQMDVDAEEALRRNLAGLQRLAPEIRRAPPALVKPKAAAPKAVPPKNSK
jgi:hypothetical protein